MMCVKHAGDHDIPARPLSTGAPGVTALQSSVNSSPVLSESCALNAADSFLAWALIASMSAAYIHV